MTAVRAGLWLFVTAMAGSLYWSYYILDASDIQPPKDEQKDVYKFPSKDDPSCTIYQYWDDQERRFHYFKECSQR